MAAIKITKEMQKAMQGVVPSTIATCSKEGIPNVTYFSQLFYVDDDHVALSWQFMNKTWRNIQENPKIRVVITCPDTFSMWKLDLHYLEQTSEGPLFEQMEMQLQSILSHVRMDFSIKAAIICRVERVQQIHQG